MAVFSDRNQKVQAQISLDPMIPERDSLTVSTLAYHAADPSSNPA